MKASRTTISREVPDTLRRSCNSLRYCWISTSLTVSPCWQYTRCQGGGKRAPLRGGLLLCYRKRIPRQSGIWARISSDRKVGANGDERPRGEERGGWGPCRPERGIARGSGDGPGGFRKTGGRRVRARQRRRGLAEVRLEGALGGGGRGGPAGGSRCACGDHWTQSGGLRRACGGPSAQPGGPRRGSGAPRQGSGASEWASVAYERRSVRHRQRSVAHRRRPVAPRSRLVGLRRRFVGHRRGPGGSRKRLVAQRKAFVGHRRGFVRLRRGSVVLRTRLVGHRRNPVDQRKGVVAPRQGLVGHRRRPVAHR